VIRDESYYFAPQGQTKIMNEGWATYWHSQLMTKLAPLHESEIIDYCDHYAGVVFARPGQINPYKMGVQLFRFIEERWNRGRFGIEYSRCDDPRVRAQWGKGENTGLGKSKIFEVRSIHNDVTFIDEFLDEDFCHEHKLFIYDFDKRTNKYVISSRDFREVKARFLQQLTNFGQPVISVVDGNFGNRGELLLRHQHDGVDLHSDYATETLKSLFRVWQRPVHIETVLENTAKRISFDGNKPTMEKTQP
jgi:stage V sporulation protein R